MEGNMRVLAKMAWMGTWCAAAAAGVVGCAGDPSTDDTGNDAGDLAPTLTIVSPGDGDTWDFGAPTTFEIAATGKQGQDVAATEVTWTSGAWSTSGSPVTVTDLPVGDHTVVVTATVVGAPLEATVDVTVVAADLSYGGSLDANLGYSGSLGTYDLACPGTVAFVVGTDGSLGGTGVCTALGSDWSFTLDGTVSDQGVVDGSMTMTFQGETATTPFTGTSSGTTMTASYDTTHTSGVESVRVYGTWSATRD